MIRRNGRAYYPADYPVFDIRGRAQRRRNFGGSASDCKVDTSSDECQNDEWVFSIGGGGSAKSGVENKVCAYRLSVSKEGFELNESGVFGMGANRLPTSLDASRDGSMLAVSVAGGCVLLRFDSSNSSISELAAWNTDQKLTDGGPANQSSVCFCEGEHILVATAGNDMMAHIWRIEKRNSTMDGTIIENLAGHNANTESREPGEDSDNTLPWKASLEYSLSGHTKEIKGMHCSPNGYELATISADQTCRVWDLKQRRVSSVLPSDMAQGLSYRKCLFRFGQDDRDCLLTLQVRSGKNAATYLVEFVRKNAGDQGQEWVLLRSKKIFNRLSTTFTVSSSHIIIGDSLGTITVLQSKSLDPIRVFEQVHCLPVTGLSTATIGGKALPCIVSGGIDKSLVAVSLQPPQSFSRMTIVLALIILAIAFLASSNWNDLEIRTRQIADSILNQLS